MDKNKEIKEEFNDIEKRIAKEIDVLQNQLNLIRNLEIKAVDIDTWKAICETPLRNSEILLDIIEKTFPMGENFRLGSNYVSFEIDGISVQIPTYRSSVIKIDMSWYKKSESKPYIRNQYEKMREYFNFLDSGNYTWYDLANCRCSHRVDWSKSRLFVWWYTKAKWRKVDKDKWEERFAIEDKQNEDAILTYNYEMKISKDKLKILKEKVLPILTDFSEVQANVNYKWLNDKELIELE